MKISAISKKSGYESKSNATKFKMYYSYSINSFFLALKVAA